MRGLRLAAVLSAVMGVSALGQTAPSSTDAPPHLFRVIGPREDVTIGLTAAEFKSMGSEPGVTRLARKLVTDGQITVWRYAVGRAADGTTQMAPAGRIAILRNDALRIEDYRAALPVASPPR